MSTSITERRIGAASGPAADGVLEEDVGREADRVVREEGEMVVGVAGRLQRLDPEPARLDAALDDLDAVARDELVVARDVVAVGVGREQVRDRQPFALDHLVQRVERRAAVDEHGRAARLVRQ